MSVHSQLRVWRAASAHRRAARSERGRRRRCAARRGRACRRSRRPPPRPPRMRPRTPASRASLPAARRQREPAAASACARAPRAQGTGKAHQRGPHAQRSPIRRRGWTSRWRAMQRRTAQRAARSAVQGMRPARGVCCAKQWRLRKGAYAAPARGGAGPLQARARSREGLLLAPFSALTHSQPARLSSQKATSPLACPTASRLPTGPNASAVTCAAPRVLAGGPAPASPRRGGAPREPRTRPQQRGREAVRGRRMFGHWEAGPQRPAGCPRAGSPPLPAMAWQAGARRRPCLTRALRAHACLPGTCASYCMRRRSRSAGLRSDTAGAMVSHALQRRRRPQPRGERLAARSTSRMLTCIPPGARRQRRGARRGVVAGARRAQARDLRRGRRRGAVRGAQAARQQHQRQPARQPERDQAMEAGLPRRRAGWAAGMPALSWRNCMPEGTHEATAQQGGRQLPAGSSGGSNSQARRRVQQATRSPPAWAASRPRAHSYSWVGCP